ncbi:DUF5004 domain-containing protein [Spongiimicrobium sp. 3-5]|uniref:DUF5004 domain-containing protein n=1 Tax=Spongiimicrobium sp. 3-5 TaxID=3332596 RepID=UPI00397F422F
MKKAFFAICLIAFFFVSCDDDEKINPDGLVEYTVDISGTWSVVSVTQNDVDITGLFDFQSLNLEFVYDGDTPSSFKMTKTSGVPFPFSMADGDFTFDDLTYPTELAFSGNQSTSIKLAAVPLISNGSNMQLAVNYGCADNSYVYTFKKN